MPHSHTFLSAFLIALVAVTGTVSAQDAIFVDATGLVPASDAVQSPIDSRTKETKESGEKGGTEDINIGVGELQESESTGIEPDEIDARNTDTEKKGNVEVQWKVEEGEKTPGVEPDEIDVKNDPEEAGFDAFIKIDDIDGESAAPGVEPDEIDVAADSEPLTPDFSILLGGGDADDRPSEEGLMEAADILLAGMKEQGAPAETLSLNFEKIKATAKQPVKLLGFIPMDIKATVEIDAEQNVKVKFPWWAFLASGKDGEALGQSIFGALSNVLQTQHDTVMNAIRNMK